MKHHLQARVSSLTMRARNHVGDQWPAVRHDIYGRFRLVTAGLLPQYDVSMIHRETFNKILGTIYEDMNDGTQAQVKQYSIRFFAEHTVRLFISVSFVLPTWNARVS